jgi:hypothetical protein
VNKYRVRKTFFVYADTLEEVKDNSDELKEHDILEIDLIEEDDGVEC